MAAPDWLTSRPIAHRGLHDIARGVVENSASAVAAAVAGRYGIEVDLQASADGEAMVHHDDALGRLTEGRANLAELSAAELKRVPFRATTVRWRASRACWRPMRVPLRRCRSTRASSPACGAPPRRSCAASCRNAVS